MNLSIYFVAGCRLFRGRLPAPGGSLPGACLPPLRAWRALRDCRKDKAIYGRRSRLEHKIRPTGREPELGMRRVRETLDD